MGSPPRRLPFAWVALIAFGLMVPGVFVALMQSTPSSRAVENATFWMLFAVPVTGGFSLVWLGIIWWIFWWKRQWPGRTWLALLPSVAVFAAAILGAALQPPREQRVRQSFEEVFGVPMPAEARDLDVSAPGLGDSSKCFTFRCPPQETQELLLAMQFGRDLNADSEPRENHWYERRDEHGRHWTLIASLAMDWVEVSRLPAMTDADTP